MAIVPHFPRSRTHGVLGGYVERKRQQLDDPRTFIDELFSGLVVSRLACHNCSYVRAPPLPRLRS